MDVTHLMRMMTTSISEVMETMFFTPVEPQKARSLEGCGFLKDSNIRACAITFSGSFAGQLFIFVPESLLSILTENFMGEPKDTLTEEYLVGTLKETLNMIAGNTFSKIDPNASFGLGIPEMDKKLYATLCQSATTKEKRSTIFTVNTMDGEMVVGFCLD